MEKRVKALDKMRDMGKKKSNKENFDLNYMKVIQFYKDFGKKAIEVLKDSRYDELCDITKHEKGFCHHDFTYHNIVIDDDNNVNVIDFDYCKREIRSYDISSFMIKVLKRSDWNMENARLILDSYNEVSPLKEEEYRVIFAFLLFPQRFWRLANRYYYNEVNWKLNTFNNKLEELISEQEKYIHFIEEFKNTYNQK
jgi:spore coat-associated protein S